MATEQPAAVPTELAWSFKLLRKDNWESGTVWSHPQWVYDWDTILAWRMTQNRHNRAALQALLENLTIAMDKAEATWRAQPSPEAQRMYVHIFGAAQGLDDLLSNILEKQGSAPWVHATPEEEA